MSAAVVPGHSADRLPPCRTSPQEVCTLLLAAHLLGDQISLVNWLGFALCLLGISLHVALKALHSRGTQGPCPGRLSFPYTQPQPWLLLLGGGWRERG